MERLRDRSTRAWPSGGITGEVADEIYEKLAAFANFGFPESHSVSFAYLVYASAWLKRYYPAAFCAGAAATRSRWASTRRRRWSPTPAATASRCAGPTSTHRRRAGPRASPTLEAVASVASDWSDLRWRRCAVRLGLASVRAIGDDLAERIAAGRPYRRHGGPGPPDRR